MRLKLWSVLYLVFLLFNVVLEFQFSMSNFQISMFSQCEFELFGIEDQSNVSWKYAHV